MLHILYHKFFTSYYSLHIWYLPVWLPKIFNSYFYSLLLYLFHLGNYFISVRVTVDPEPIPGTLGVKWEKSHRMGRRSVTGSRAQTHTRSYLQAIYCSQSTYLHVLDSGRKTGEPRGNPHKHRENMQISTQTVTWAQAPWSCEAAMLPAATQCHL